MLIVLNIAVIGLVGLIAYWWANQGLFSAILHLLCVVLAGAIALAVWEPITTGLLLRGSLFDDYAWGITLVLVFALSLAILRVTLDKIAPGNVALPHWADMGFGFPVGAAAGVLSIGIVMIGAGHIQSINSIMDFQGKARTRGGKIEELETLWVPVHVWTAEFYSLLSAGSLYPTFNNTPLRQYEPDLAYQAAGLLRDSALSGRAKISLKPSDAHIEEMLYDAAAGRYMVRVRFEAGARDFGEQLTLSSSQIRLIGAATGFTKPKVVHPDQWTQYDGVHRFDDLSHYATSEPGQSEATMTFEFPAAELGGIQPKFIQIRGTRYRLPQPKEGTAATARSTAGDFTGELVKVDPTARNIQQAVEQTNSIRPVTVSTNQMPAGIKLSEDRFITGGDGEFMTSGGERPSRNLMVQGIYEPEKTRIVQVDVSRESPANLFGLVRTQAGEKAVIMLVDSQGRTYRPVGYIHQKPDGHTRIFVDFQHYLATMNDIPSLPTSGGQPLKLLFNVTEGATLVGLKLGDVSVGRFELKVKDPKATS